MKIALDISPLSSGHKYRGTGFYTLHLKNAFEKYFPEHRYTFFSQKKEIPKDVDVIHYPYFDPFSLSIPFSNRKKTIVTVLDLIPLLFPNEFPAGIKGNIKWQIQKHALKSVAGIITDSQSAKSDIKKLVGVDSSPIVVTYLAAGEEFKKIEHGKMKIEKEIRQKYNLPESFVLYVGDVTWNKNLPRLVEACIQARTPLVMVGKSLVNNDFDKTNVWNHDLIKVLQLAESNQLIQRLGFVPDSDLVGLYNSATIFAMPSLYEGFGLPILEAMKCGCPVVTSKEASLPEVAGGAGYVVDANSVDSIKEGIEKVMQSKKMQEDLSKKGIAQAKKFSWKATAQKTLDFYKQSLMVE